MSLVHHYSTSVGAVAVTGTTALVAQGSRLDVLDVADLVHPALVGALDLGPGAIEGIAFNSDGTLAFVTNPSFGVHILDLQAPARPRLVAQIDLPGAAQVAFRDPYLYVVAGDPGLVTLSVEDPPRPREVGRLAFGVPIDAALALDRAIIVRQAHPPQLSHCPGVLFATLVDGIPGHVAGTYPFSGAPTAPPVPMDSSPETCNWPIGVAMPSGSQAVIFGPRHFTEPEWPLLDLVDPERARLVGSAPLPRWTDALVADGTLAVSVSSGQLETWTFADPTAIRRVGNTTLPAWPSCGAGKAPIALDHGRLLASGPPCYDSIGVFLADVSDPASPTVASQYRLPTRAIDIAVSGNRLYYAAGALGVVALDISDLDRPRVLGSIAFPESIMSVAVHDDRVFASTAAPVYDLQADPKALIRVIDAADPAHMSVLGSVGVDDVGDGLAVDVTNPHAPAAKPLSAIDHGGMRGFSDDTYLVLLPGGVPGQGTSRAPQLNTAPRESVAWWRSRGEGTTPGEYYDPVEVLADGRVASQFVLWDPRPIPAGRRLADLYAYGEFRWSGPDDSWSIDAREDFVFVSAGESGIYVYNLVPNDTVR